MACAGRGQADPPDYGAAMSDSPSADHSEPVVVATYADRGEAEIAQAKLRAFGIESAVLDQAEVIPTIELTVGIGVEVKAVDADDAFRILSDTTDV